MALLRTNSPHKKPIEHCKQKRSIEHARAPHSLHFFCRTAASATFEFPHPAALTRHGFRCRTPAQPIDRCAYRPGEVPGLMRERPPAQPNLTLAHAELPFVFLARDSLNIAI